jgi:indole-3-glycerol phosphate synthase
LSILNQIIEQKKQEIDQLKNHAFKFSNAKEASFLKTLKKNRLNLIAEVKQASPSKGTIYNAFDPIKLAESFERHGAACISVLTDEKFFNGHRNDLMKVKKSVNIPILRKDFIIDPLQVKETKEMGADLMLIILDILSVDQANELIDLARMLQIEVLIEIHSDEALEKLTSIHHKPLVGVNNRDLNSFICNTSRAIALSKEIKSLNNNIIVIAESGYSEPKEMLELENNKINGVLIGEGLSKNKLLLEWFNNEN